MSENHEDVRAIRTIIARQFASLDWSSGRSADWDAFTGDFHPDATLYPAARPLTPKTVEAFVSRMKGLAENSLKTFSERVLGADIRVFGHVAVAMAACEMTENGETTSRSVEAMLLVKDGGRWQIVAQGWDTESDGKQIPAALMADSCDPET